MIRSSLLRQITRVFALALGVISSLAGEAARSDSCVDQATRRELQALSRERRALRLDRRRYLEGLKSESIDYKRTLDFLEEIESGSREGARQVYRIKDGAQWFSNYGYKDSNPDLDPRFFALLGGAGVGRFFGFETRDRSRVVLPSAARLEWAIREVNTQLGGDAIPLHFRRVPGKIDVFEYLREFAEHGFLPVSDELFLHDINVHSPALFLPPEEILLSRRQAQAINDFGEFLRRRNPRAFDVHFEDIVDIMVGSIDLATGNAGRYLTNRKRAYFYGHVRLANRGMSPGDNLRSYRNFSRELASLIDEFLVDYEREHPAMREGFAQTESGFEKAMERRIRSIQRAVFQIQNRGR